MVLGAGVFLTFFGGVLWIFVYFLRIKRRCRACCSGIRSVRRSGMVLEAGQGRRVRWERPQGTVVPVSCHLCLVSCLYILLVSCLLFPRLSPACLLDRLASFSPCILAHRTSGICAGGAGQVVQCW